MGNTVQLKKNGQNVYPLTDRSCVIGLNDGPIGEFRYAWKGTTTPVPADIPAGVQVEYDSNTYTGTLAASASTSGYFYLVYNTTSTKYDMYGTDATGGTYAWVPMGDTTIQSPDIADDLVTNDSTKALSAKQGKVLNDELSELDLILNKNYKPGYYLDKYGAEISDANWGISDYIPYPGSGSITWRWNDTFSNASTRCIVFYNAQKVMLDYYAASSASQQDDGRVISSIVAGTAYIRASFLLGTSSKVKIDNVLVWQPNDGLVSEFFEIETEVSEIKTEVKALTDDATMPTMVDFMDFGGNMFDKLASGVEVGGYVNVTNGQIYASEHWVSSDYIHLKTGVDYIMPCYPDLYGALSNRVAYYGKDKAYIGNVTGTETNGILVFSLPETAYYVRVTVADTEVDSFMLMEGDTYPSTYKAHLWKPNKYFDGNIGNPLIGKKVSYDGDSIARGGAYSSNYGWSPIIAENNAGTFVSHAVGGATITSETYTGGGSARHWICEGIETIYNNAENPDLIIFEGGTNDADIIGSILDENNLPANFGSWTPTDFAGPFDKTKFCGAVEYMFQKALSLFPHTKFGFIIAQKMGRNQASDTVKNRKAYFDVIAELCKKWGIPYINLWDEGFLNPAIDSHYNPNLDADGNEAAGSLYRDGQHLTLKGYQSITSKIEAWMKTL